MKKINSLIIILILASWPGVAQINPDDLTSSLVRVEVSTPGSSTAGVCSGFVWTKNSWIVTSLHAMKKDGIIKVTYLNKDHYYADIIGVLKDADLVLLETRVDDDPIDNEVKPIMDFAKKEVQWREELFTWGYHAGASGYRDQDLKRGHAKPGTLEHLVVKQEDKDALHDLGFPNMTLPVMYLIGSLLPGYSGSPIFNNKGELVAISDGGLENGQDNVSWAIPASHLDDLKETDNPDLPESIDKADVLFSAEYKVAVSGGNNAATEEKTTENYSAYIDGEFQFYPTKNRSFITMVESSIDPDNLLYFAEEFEDMNLFIDYEILWFDIYEDVKHGVVIAVPEESPLIYDRQTEAFTADLSIYGDIASYFSLEYGGYIDEEAYFDDIDMAIDVLLESLDEEFGYMVNGFTEDEEYSYTMAVDDYREMGYILYTGNESYFDEYGDELALQFYLTVLLKENQIFYTLATMWIPAGQLSAALETGIDCVENYNEYNADYCEYFEMLMSVVAASHLTTFANTQIVATRN